MKISVADYRLDDDAETPCKVRYYYSPGSPARTYGPPEDCYEGDPAEFEVQAVSLDGGKTWLTGDVIPEAFNAEAFESHTLALIAAEEDARLCERAEFERDYSDWIRGLEA
jgi:hypothetical protein